MKAKNNKSHIVHINVTLRRVRVTIVAKICKLYIFWMYVLVPGIQHAVRLRYIIICGLPGSIVCLKRDGTRAETRIHLSPKRTSPFKSAGASVQSTAGSRAVSISVSNAGYTTFRGSVRVLATHSIRQFPLHFPSRASPCAIRFETHSTTFFPIMS
jgi:hypothetical protein